jgi:3-dehydroquinate synthase II
MNCEIYVQSLPFDKSLVTQALEAGADGIVTDEENISEVMALCRTQVLTPADLVSIELGGAEDEEQAARALMAGHRVVLARGWEIIPVENLLARNAPGLLGLEVSSRTRLDWPWAFWSGERIFWFLSLKRPPDSNLCSRT